MADFYSGLFHPEGSGSTSRPGASVFFNNRVFFFNAGSKQSNYRIYALECLKPYDVTAYDAWKNAAIPEDQVGGKVESGWATAPVVVGDSLFLFWNVPVFGFGIAATRLGIDGRWSRASVVGEKDPIGSGGAAVSATAVGGNIILTELNFTTRKVNWWVLNPLKFSPGKNWAPDSRTVVTASDIAKRAGVKAEIDGVAGYASSDWFSQGGGLNGNVLVQSFSVRYPNSPDDYTGITALLQLDPELKPIWSAASRAFKWDMGDDDTRCGIQVVRDAGGRMRCYYTNKSGAVFTRLMGTRGSFSQLSWQDAKLLNNTEVTTKISPAATYAPGEPLSGGNEYDVREFVFTARDKIIDDVECQVAPYGHLVRTLDAESLKLSEESRSIVPQGIRLLRGYIDGPVPMPSANLREDPTQASGSTVYGQTSGTEMTHEVTQDWQVGVKTEGEASAGTGPAWDISFSGGGGSTFGYSTAQSTTYSDEQRTVVNRENGDIVAYGTAFLDEITLVRRGYEFFPTDSKSRAEDMTEFAKIEARFSNRIGRAYKVKTVTPGDLASYTEDAWNRRMQHLGFGPDYIKTQILPQALDLDGPGPSNALSFSWTLSGGTGAATGWTVSSFSESRWTFQSEVYAGVSFDFWGIARAKFLVGASFSSQTKSSTKDSRTLGINLTFAVPSPVGVPGTVIQYAFDLYFLPASTQWTNEFITLVQLEDPDLVKQIDPNSQCWKIIYVVTGFLLDASLDELAKHGLADSRIAALKTAGIATCGQALLHLRADAKLDAIDYRLKCATADGDREALTALRAWFVAARQVGSCS